MATGDGGKPKTSTGEPRTEKAGVAGSVTDAALLAELEFLLAHAGHDIPADRLPGVLAGYRDLKAMQALLRQPRTAANEPANVYSLHSVTRGAMT